jgi:hypothetical protein
MDIVTLPSDVASEEEAGPLLERIGTQDRKLSLPVDSIQNFRRPQGVKFIKKSAESKCKIRCEQRREKKRCSQWGMEGQTTI